MKNIKSNIWKIYIIRALQWFMLLMPIIVLFFKSYELTMSEVLLLQTIFGVSVLIFEIPSGYFADVVGRKFSIIIGLAFTSLAMILFSLTYSFWGFVAVEILLGIGASMTSGADSALIYDTLIELKQKGRYKMVEGRISAISSFSEGIAGFLGGSLALVSLRTPLYIQTILIILAFIMSWTLIEPKRIKNDNKEGAFKGILKIVKYSMHDHKEVKWLILYTSCISASGLIIVWLLQPYLEMVNLPLAYFGIVWGILNLSIAVFALQSERFEKLIGRKKSLISLVFLMLVGHIILGMISSVIAILAMFIFYFVRGIKQPILNDYINTHITSDMRATVLSVQSLLFRLLFSVFGPFIGWISDAYTLQTAILSSGLIFFTFSAISVFFLHKHKAL